MLAKVSYNAYASSANAMQRPNQSQNVNFGTMTSNDLAALRLFRTSLIQSPGDKAPSICGIFNVNKIVSRMKVLLEFLDICQKQPQADSQQLLKRVIGTIDLKQKNPNYADTVARSEAITDVLKFCDEHQHLSAGEIFEGATTGLSLEAMQETLTFMLARK